MIENLMNTLISFNFTSTMGILLYWVPVSVCVYGYTVRTWLNYQKDVGQREKVQTQQPDKDGRVPKFYSPTDTIGTLIGRALVTALPVANIWAAAFDVAPKLFSTLFKWIGRVFDQPLVPRHK